MHHAMVEGGFTNAHFAAFSSELNDLVDEPWTMVHDGARAHNAVPGLDAALATKQLAPYSPFLNAAEMAGSCLKAAVGRTLCQPQVREELIDTAAAANAGVTLHAWRMAILKREVTAALPELTQQKCLRWVNHTQPTSIVAWIMKTFWLSMYFS